MMSNPIVRRSSLLKFAGRWMVVMAAVVSCATGSLAQPYGRTISLAEVKDGAERGDTAMQRLLGLRYLSGEGVTKNESEALRWLKQAGEKGDAQAQFALANIYEFGKGVPVNMSEAIRWYRPAAEQNVLNAQFNLGDSYLRGLGVKKDANEAMKWFRMAAAQGDPDAKARLGVAFLTGEGLPLSYSDASAYLRDVSYELSRTDLQPMAQYYLGTMYRDGLGMKQDDVDAAKWFKKSAQGGYPEGMYSWARILIDGKSKDGMDVTTGNQWLQRAAAKGHVKSTEYLAGIKRHDGKNRSVLSTKGKPVDTTRPGYEPEEYTKAEAAVVGVYTGAAKQVGEGFTSLQKSIDSGELATKFSDLGNSLFSGGDKEKKEGLQGMAEGALKDAAKEQVTKAAGGQMANAMGSTGTPSFVKAAGNAAKEMESFSSSPPGAAKLPTAFLSQPGGSAVAKSANAGFKSFGIEPKKTDTGNSFASRSLPTMEEEMARLKAKFDAEKTGGTAGEKSFVAAPVSSSFNSSPTGFEKTSIGEPKSSATGIAFGQSSPATSAGGGLGDGGGEKASAAFSSSADAAVASSVEASRAVGTPRVDYGDSGAGFPVGIAYITLAMATAMVFISLMFFFTFKTRVHSLESEIKKAQFELSKANVNLSSMMHQVEQLALQAPGEQESGQGIVSLPDWGGQKPEGGEAEGFKISRPR